MKLRHLAVVPAIAACLALAQEPGLPARDSGARYQTHEEADGTTIAASVVSPRQAAKLFTTEVSRKYIVVEVAVYPESGQELNIHLLDFALKRKSGKSLPANPEEVASVWGQARPELYRRPAAMGAANIANAPPLYGTGPQSRSLEGKLRNLALPHGRIGRPVAGYLYFPVSKGQAQEATGLKYLSLEYLAPGGAAIRLNLH